MVNPLSPLLENGRRAILDGGLATELERRGADLRDPLWSAKLLLDDPDLIRHVHLDYLRAGAQIITSASYQASFAGFAKRGLDRDRAADLMRLSVRLAQEARAEFRRMHHGSQSRGTHKDPCGTHKDPCGTHKDSCATAVPAVPPLVAASVGCYGATLHDGSEYRGDYGLSVRELIDWHRPRLAVLAAGGADLLACETIPCLAEAEALVRLLEEFQEVPAWLSFSCRDETHVCHGETLVDCVRVAESGANVVAVGINCTPPQFVESLLRSLAGATTKALLAYPNNGESWDATKQCWTHGATSMDWGQAARRWRAAGATLIGGCCRTTPETIRSIASAFAS